MRLDCDTRMKNANARVHIGEAPYIQMEMSDMEGKVFYGIDDKKRIWMKKQLEGKVTSIYRWKDRASCINGDTAAVVTQHKIRHLISISSGNSRFTEPLPNIAWSTVLPVNVEDGPSGSEPSSVSNWSDDWARYEASLGPATRVIVNRRSRSNDE